MSDGVNSAATLSLEISTRDAHEKLTALETRMTGLGAKLESLLHAGGVASAGSLDELAKRMQTNLDQQVKAATAGLSAQLANQQKLIDDFNAKSLDASKGVRTSLASGSASLAGSLQLDEGQLTRFYGRMKAAGLESVKALEEGITRANFTKSNNVIEAFRKNTEASLQGVLRMSREAQQALRSYGPQTAADTYGQFLVGGDAEARANKALAALAKDRQVNEQRLAQEKTATDSVAIANRTRAAEEKLAAETVAVSARTRAAEEKLAAETVAVSARTRAAEEAKASESLAVIRRTRAAEEKLAAETAAIAARTLADEKRIGAERAAWQVRQLDLERNYILASQAQRLKAAIDARKLIDAGYKGNLASEFAPSTVALASSTSVKQLEAQYAALAVATRGAAGAQLHWNEIAHQGNRLARGLAGSLGGLWLTYGSLVPLVAAAALASSLKAVITVGKDLEYQFTYIQAITEGTVISLNELGDAIKGTIFTPTEAAGALRILAQAGLEVNEAMAALPSVLKLATVGEVDVAGAALTTTSVMHTFGLAVSDISHIVDVFARADRLSATSVKEMMEAMKQASSVANIFGVSVEETAAALATLANRGIEGSAAGTAIRNMVKELASPASKRAAEALKQYGIEIFNADGSAKKFTANLKELSNVTAVMSSQTKARFLEDMFNERGAKAANILLTDLEKMNQTLKEIEMSSRGLGFMTEAQVRVAQSLDGMMKAAKSGLEETFAKVYQSVRPEIEGIVDSLGKLARSDGLKTTLTVIANGFINLTEALREHATIIGTVAAAYAGFIIVKTVGTLLTGLSIAAWGATSALVGLNGAIAGLVVTGKAGGAIAIITRLATLLNGPLQVGIIAVSAVAAIYAMRMRETDDSIDKLLGSTKDLSDAQGRLNNSMLQGLQGLIDSNKLQAERIRLLREGKSAADAAAQSSDNLGYAQAKVAAQSAKDAEAAALANLGSSKFADEGGRAARGEDQSDAYKKAQAQFERAVEYRKKAEEQLAVSATGSIKASMEGRAKEAQDIVEKAHAEVRVQNAKFEQIKEIARLAQKEIDSGATISAERRKRLDKDIARGAGAEKFAPIDPKTSETEATKIELRRREDFIAEHDPGYVAYKAPSKTGRGELKDYRAIQNDNLSSALKREQIKLGAELVGVEVGLAAQTISAAVAQERKNAASVAELEVEREIIAQYLKEATAKGDEVQIRKIQNDLDENALKIAKQREQAGLDLIKVFTANTNAIEDAGLASANYAQDLQFEIDMMGRTSAEVARLRIEYEQMRAIQNLNVRADRNLDNPEVIQALRDEINAKAAARLADAEYQESYAGGWAKAYDAYTKSATSAAKQAADAFQLMSSTMENALDEFLSTGKLNFADFAKSLILGMAKIEGRSLLAKMSLSAGGDSGGGFGSVVKSLLGGIMSMFGGGASASTTAVQSAGGVANSTPWAKGGAFIGSPSLHQYANTVQTTPRMFEYQNLHGFAKGGIFAEAGPEAVMPIMQSELGRDSKGRLGIKRNTGDTYNLKVVVMGSNNAPDVRRSAGQGAREALAAFKGAHRFE